MLVSVNNPRVTCFCVVIQCKYGIELFNYLKRGSDMIPSLPSLLVIHYGFGLYLGVFFFLCTYFYFQLERMRKSYECTSNPTLDNSQTQNKIKPSWEGGRGLVLIFQRRLSSRKTRVGTRESQNRSHEAGSSRDGWKRQSSNKLEYEFVIKKETLH